MNFEELAMTAETVHIRPMNENDLEESDKIMRLAFGTFLGLPEPILFMGDAGYVSTRYKADPSAALVAITHDSRIVGSNFALDWGSVGIFGPLTVHPNYWDKGVARELLRETMKIFQRWGSKHLGLFTFAQSSKHVHLYQKFDFWPRYLTAIMSRNIAEKGPEEQLSTRKPYFSTYSEFSQAEKARIVTECKTLTNGIYEGLDLRKEITSVDQQKIGDTILLRDPNSEELLGFAVCHTGAGSEAGSGNCYVKFGAVRRGENSPQLFNELLDASDDYASSQNISRVVAGVNMARHGAYKSMIGRGFRTDMQGVTMHRPNEPGYNFPDIYLIDDWR
ncbi:MAG TPA: GNAT family N-acetyltransferase [Nitrososphaera sp.]|nr:GNAT family N-acetyltransferase [Nitrososphaera sp.]